MTSDLARRPSVLVSYKVSDEVRSVFKSKLASVADVLFLGDNEKARKGLLESADVLVSFLPHSEILDDEWSSSPARLLQVATSGVNHLHFNLIPPDMLVARTPGAQSEAIAEHALALALAAAKDITGFRRKLASGEFDFETQTRLLHGGTVCVVGLGLVGRAVARLFRAIGMSVNAINTTGQTDEPSVSKIGTINDLKAMVASADVVAITLALTEETRNLIGAEALCAMRPDAILVNVARGRIIDQTALYEHLVANPKFYACIDAWWEEPFNEGRFHVEHPFFDLPNIIGTPHNASRVPSMAAKIAATAAENVWRFVTTGEVRHVVASHERRWV